MSVPGRAIDIGEPVWPIVGHEEAVGALRRSLARDRVSHAYLVAGPAGGGKATLARAFAQALCCQSADRPDLTVPCGNCLSCRKIARSTHPDVQALDLERQRAVSDKRGGQNTSLTIDSIRQLTSDAALRPMEAPRRIILIDDAESMQEVAQEALLKTLEEPPPAVLLMLLADDAGRLLPTIQSRCQMINLRPVPVATIAAALERSGLEPARAREIAVLSAGRPGWAMRAAGDASLVEAQRGTAERALRWVDSSIYGRLVRAFRLGDSFPKRRTDVVGDVTALLGLWRDILVLRLGLHDLVLHQALAEQMTTLASDWSLEAITRSTRSVQTCLSDLEANVRPRLALEAMVLQWPPSPARPNAGAADRGRR